MSWLYLLQAKWYAFDCFAKFKTLVENQSSYRIKKLRTAWGVEFISNEFKDFCNKHGIKRQYIASYTPLEPSRERTK